MRLAPRMALVAMVVALLGACSQSSAPTVPVAAPVTPSIAVPIRSKTPKPRPKATRSKHPSGKPKPRPRPKPHPAGVPSVDVPNPSLTPGVALRVGPRRICVAGYSASVRDVPDSEKQQVYDRYHIVWVPYRHEVDHLISLEIGGSNAIRNLWPEPYAGRWGAHTKDVLEDRLHQLVCDGDLSLGAAQRQEATNWVAAYRRYVGAPPAGVGSGEGSISAGGYYASSYPTASTIYCADDPEWRYLSKTYLVHFGTFAQAKSRFPGYHLHRPC